MNLRAIEIDLLSAATVHHGLSLPTYRGLADRHHQLFKIDGLLMMLRRPRFPKCDLPFVVFNIPVELLSHDDGILVAVPQIGELLLV
jgi:hypothetical protein